MPTFFLDVEKQRRDTRAVVEMEDWRSSVSIVTIEWRMRSAGSRATGGASSRVRNFKCLIPHSERAQERASSSAQHTPPCASSVSSKHFERCRSFMDER